MTGLNVNFSKSFVEIGCAGEIKLNIDESDYTKAGVEIWVKFRAVDPLRQLDAHVQSGGERSVCTMLYLIALQVSILIELRELNSNIFLLAFDVVSIPIGR